VGPANVDNFTGGDLRYGFNTTPEERAEILQPIRPRCQNDYGNPTASQILLVAKICVQRDKHVESAFGEVQQLSICFACPAGFLNRQTGVCG
jgi:hypothetical protein